jgi:hypothetical protein
MAASKIQANWSTVSHAAQAITKVTAVTFSQGGALQTFAGDTDRYDTVIVNLMNKPTASITSADIGTLMGIAPGTTGSLTATHKDAKLASGGDIIYVLANAVAENATANGPFGNFGSATLSFRSFSNDGSTNPLSFTRA